MTEEQEHICKTIDQRNADRLLVRLFEMEHEPKQLFWTGRLRLNVKTESCLRK